MRRIEKPIFSALSVFERCVEGISELGLQKKLNAIAKEIFNAGKSYEENAALCTLYSVATFRGKDDAFVAANVSKGELKSLYSKYLVAKGKPGRVIYEQLLGLSPQKLCPQCGFGHVKTLDHYLPKSKYPLYSVLPQNLVPACRDCNTGKLASTATQPGEQPIHPYFDAAYFFEEQWLYAEVVQTVPASITFFVSPPVKWDKISKERVQSHFEGFELSERFSVQVATELAAIRNYLPILPDEQSRGEHLAERAKVYSELHKNSWQTALSQALANSLWYCQIGYLG
jgi:hypothetical protein